MSTATAAAVHRALRRAADPRRAIILQRYFKTGPGEYGEGDRFLGLRLPQVREIARTYQDLPRAEAARVLRSKWHEERLAALLILLRQYGRGDARTREAIYRLYLRSTKRINNWDLVDVSAPGIVGVHLLERDRSPLRRLAGSRSLWERRIAMLATFAFIRRNEFRDALAIARMLLDDREDLIHKAVGWMLREVGQRDRATLERFLRQHGRRIPRTALRYAIERFPSALRQRYLRSTR